MKLELTQDESAAMLSFRRTGRYVGKDARWAYRPRKQGTKDVTLYRLREMGLLEHFCADQWYLTEAGRFMVKSV